MKRLLIVPILALAGMLIAPAAYANHGGAQSPDIEEDSEKCEVAFVFHASCQVSGEAERPYVRARVAGVPTADGWHVKFSSKVLDNVAGVIETGTIEVTLPYTADWFGTGVPHPNTFVMGLSGPVGSATTTDATCYVDVEAGTGRTMRCGLWGHWDFLLPYHTPA